MRIKVKVTPNTKREGLQIIKDLLTNEDVYHIKLHAKPKDGEANKALVSFLSDYFDVSKSSVTIVKGQTSSRKIVEIEMRN